MGISVSATSLSGTSGSTVGPKDAEEGAAAIADISADVTFLSASSGTFKGALSAVGEITGLEVGVLTAAPIVGETDKILCLGTIKNFLSPKIVMLCGLGTWVESVGFLGGELFEFN